MCMVAYIASHSPLPLIPFQESAPAFNVTELTEGERMVLSHLALPYVRQHAVKQIYSCWSGDEGEPQKSVRHITPEDLVANNFFFRERELLIVDLTA